MTTVISERKAKRTLTPTDKKYCLKKLLEKVTWYENSKLPKIGEYDQKIN